MISAEMQKKSDVSLFKKWGKCVHIHTWMYEFIVIADPQLQKLEATKQQQLVCRCQLLAMCIH